VPDLRLDSDIDGGPLPILLSIGCVPTPALPNIMLRFALGFRLLTLITSLMASSLVGCISTPKALPAGPYLFVLGTAQDGGLPQLGCRKDCCVAARKDPRKCRLVTSLLLVDPRTQQRWLFDASPDLPEQVERAHPHGGTDKSAMGRPALFDGIFLTHAHLGHYTGLLHLGREAYGTQTTPVIATPKMLRFLQEQDPWSLLFDAKHLSSQPLPAGETIQLAEDLSVTAWQVPHRDEFSDTVCFIIRGPNHSALYLPDIDKWNRWERALIDVLAEVDYALIDGTFYGPDELPGRDMAQVPHPFIVETQNLLQNAEPDLRGRVYFTHLNHSNPVADPTSPEAEQVRNQGAFILQERALFEL
jgi:pyrroloquinoline quinone biosynthesis protein B